MAHRVLIINKVDKSIESFTDSAFEVRSITANRVSDSMVEISDFLPHFVIVDHDYQIDRLKRFQKWLNLTLDQVFFIVKIDSYDNEDIKRTFSSTECHFIQSSFSLAELKHTISNIKEIEDLKAEVEKLTLQNQYISKFASIGELSGQISHEINSPLGAISLTAEQILRSSDDEKVKKYCERISKASEKIGAITKALRYISNPSFSNAIEQYNVKDLVDKITLLIGGKLKNESLFSVTYNGQSDKYIIEAILLNISQIFFNLLNASIEGVKNQEESWISLEITPNENNLEFHFKYSKEKANDKIDDVFEKTLQILSNDDQGLVKEKALQLKTSVDLAKKFHGHIVYAPENDFNAYILTVPIHSTGEYAA